MDGLARVRNRSLEQVDHSCRCPQVRRAGRLALQELQTRPPARLGSCMTPKHVYCAAHLSPDKLRLQPLAGCTEGHLLRDDPLPGIVHLGDHPVPAVGPLGHPAGADLGQALARVDVLQVNSCQLREVDRQL